MKAAKGKLILLSLLLFYIIGTNGFAQKSPSRGPLNFGSRSTLKLETLTEKPQYVAYEPVLFTVKLTNLSQNEGFDVTQPFHIIFSSCEVLDPDGSKLPLNEQYAVMIIGGGTQLLGPGQTFEKTFNLLDYFDMGKRTGKYRVEYRYPLKELSVLSLNP